MRFMFHLLGMYARSLLYRYRMRELPVLIYSMRAHKRLFAFGRPCYGQQGRALPVEIHRARNTGTLPTWL